MHYTVWPSCRILPHFRFLLHDFLRCRAGHCFRNRRSTLFSCPLNDLFSTQGLIEYEVYETVDVTEQCWERRQHEGGSMESLPAAARRVKQWVKKRSTREIFTNFYLSKLPEFFLHHQIEQVSLSFDYTELLLKFHRGFALSPQAQHDIYKIYIQLVTSTSYFLVLLIDFAENYTHIAQVNFFVPEELLWYFLYRAFQFICPSRYRS